MCDYTGTLLLGCLISFVFQILDIDMVPSLGKFCKLKVKHDFFLKLSQIFELQRQKCTLCILNGS